MDGGRWTLEAGWGLSMFGGRMLGSPRLVARVSGMTSDYALGARFEPLDGAEPSDKPPLNFTLGIHATRRESAETPPQHGVEVEIDARL